MKNKLMFGVLVKDYDEAIDFYAKKLGFVVLEDNPMGDDRWIAGSSVRLAARVIVSCA